MNIGSMIDGKTVQNSARGERVAFASAAVSMLGGASAAPREISSVVE
jgi:hypothetical protein